MISLTACSASPRSCIPRQGIHPGSTVAQLKHAYGQGLKKFPGGYALNQGTPGASPTTQFAVTNGKVSLIDIQTSFNDD